MGLRVYDKQEAVEQSRQQLMDFLSNWMYFDLESLGNPDFSDETDFEDVGYDGLEYVQLIAEVEEEFDIEIDDFPDLHHVMNASVFNLIWDIIEDKV